jgi:adenine-specific DNA-methyltransferase
MTQIQDQQEQKFIELMSEIFQLNDAEGLDFGIYRVIRNHNQKIKAFLGQVSEQGYQPGTIQQVVNDAIAQQSVQTKDLEKEIREELNDLGIDRLLPIESAMTLVKGKYAQATISKEKQLYEPILNQYDAWLNAQETYSKKSFIFSKLYEFYSQNYSDGDFITQRTFTRNSDSTKRFVQTSGEDVEFHWATEGMYYIKSGDLYSDYHAKLSDGTDLIVRVDAGQLKDTLDALKKESNPDKKAMYKFGSLVKNDQAWVLTLEYVKKGAARDIEKPLKHQEIAQQTGSDETRIRMILNKYIKRNQADFFIHQNLKEELDTNLAFFIKNNVLHLDAMLADETTLSKTLKAAKAIHQIAEKINAFLGELEDFQKTLWERKKLVVETNYIISLNKLAEYGGEHLMADILANDHQIQEWRDLNLGEYGSLESVQILDDQNAEARYLPLPVDTKHFSTDFKWQILTAIAENTHQPLDDLLDGTLFYSDNWQALNLMQEKYREKIKCTYIDPPYNTGDDGFPYKDGYLRSSWMSLIDNRLNKSKALMPNDSAIFISINHHSESDLVQVSDKVFERSNRIENLIWSKNTSKNDSKTYSNVHEYIRVYAKQKEATEADLMMFREPKPGAIEVMELVESMQANYPSIEEMQTAIRELYKRHKAEVKAQLEADGIEYGESLDPWKGILNYKLCEYRENGRYLDEELARKQKRGEIWVFREDNSSWPNPNAPEEHFYKVKHPKTGVEHPWPARGWLWPYEVDKDSNAMSFVKMNADHRIYFGDGTPVRHNKETGEAEYKVPQIKRFLHEAETDVAKSSFVDTTDGTKELNHVLGGRGNFLNPKPTSLMQRCILQTTRNDDYVLDYFAGSGSTAQAVMTIPHEFGKRKFLFVETANYFYQLLLPRIKKLTACLHWTDGKPNNLEGHGLFARYHRLEQYEDSLENITRPADLALPFDDAASMRYLLDDASCQFKEHSFDSAFNHTLNIVKGVDIDATEVDMVESLIYLLGLKVDKLYLDGKGVVITGQANRTQQSVTVAWRDCESQGSDWVKAIYDKHPADVVYSNRCGDLALDIDAELKSIEQVFLER